MTSTRHTSYWPDEKVAKLRQLWPTMMTNSQICHELGRSWESLRWKASDIGLGPRNHVKAKTGVRNLPPIDISNTVDNANRHASQLLRERCAKLLLRLAAEGVDFAL